MNGPMTLKQIEQRVRELSRQLYVPGELMQTVRDVMCEAAGIDQHETAASEELTHRLRVFQARAVFTPSCHVGYGDGWNARGEWERCRKKATSP